MTQVAERELSGQQVDWIGSLPPHWQVVSLKSLFRIVGGSTPKSDQPQYWDGEIIWITPMDLAKEDVATLYSSQRTITKEGLESCGTSLVPPNSIVLSIRAPIGSLGVAKVPLCTNQGCKTLVPSTDVDSRFVAFTLSIAREHLRVRGKGTTFLELSGDELGAFPIPAPDLSEQTAIAAFLDRETAKIDALVEEQRRLIDLLKEKRQAVISHAVTKGLNPDAPMKDTGIEWPQSIPAHWEVLSLTRVVEQFVDYRGVTPTKLEEGVPLITATQIKNGRIDHSLDPVFISEVEYRARMTRGFPAIGDVLLTTEAPLGEVAMIEEARVSPGQRMILMKVDKAKVTNEFLYRHFQSDFGRDQLAMRASGSTASGIRADRLRGSAVLVPPLDEQKQIAKYIEEKIAGFGDLNVQIENQLDLLRERRSTLIAAAVTGKIDVRALVEVEDAA